MQRRHTPSVSLTVNERVFSRSPAGQDRLVTPPHCWGRGPRVRAALRRRISRPRSCGPSTPPRLSRWPPTTPRRSVVLYSRRAALSDVSCPPRLCPLTFRQTSFHLFAVRRLKSRCSAAPPAVVLARRRHSSGVWDWVPGPSHTCPLATTSRVPRQRGHITSRCQLPSTIHLTIHCQQ